MHTRSDSSRLQARLGITAPDGRKPLVRSLGTCDVARGSVVSGKAQALADALPSGDWLKVKRLVEDIFLASGHPAPQIVREALPVLRLVLPFARDYISRKGGKVEKGELTQSHFNLLQRCILSFARAHEAMELGQVKGSHIQEWVDGLVASGLAPGSVRNQLSAVSAFFDFALAMGHISLNPCAAVEVPESAAVVVRQPMTDEDFERLSRVLLDTHKTDWRTATVNMRYAGLRLADAARLSAEGVSFLDGVCLLCLTPGKTDNPEVLPVFEPLASYLKGLGVKSGPLAPSLAKLSPSCLSKQLSKLCDLAGIDPLTIELPNGRKHRRISGHSLRHSFVTWLARLGIPEALRMKLSAHVNEDAHRGYDHQTGLDLHRQVAPYFSS